MPETTVIIVGAGPAGLAIAACLTTKSIPYILLEREDCYASLWKKKTYDRLHLHLAKQYTQLPYLNLPPSYPKYISKNEFIKYLDDYVAHFQIKPLYGNHVESAMFDHGAEKWRVVTRNEEEYVGRYLVVASGEASEPYCPEIKGLDGFVGKVMHTTEYKNGKEYKGKSVLVVGCGNSGMEIALDLANHGANISIVVRSPVHILSRRMVWMGLFLLNHFPYKMVDKLMVVLSKIVYGDLSKYGLIRPSQGPFFLKVAHGKYPVIDVGTVGKIQSGEIQVLSEITSIKGSEILFEDGRCFIFDAIIFATGFKRSTNKWLQGDEYLLKEDGMPKHEFPNHWKGNNGLYCSGLSRRGIYGLAMDAKNIAQDIQSHLESNK